MYLAPRTSVILSLWGCPFTLDVCPWDKESSPSVVRTNPPHRPTDSLDLDYDPH